jgi:hypothetical protein
VPLRPLTPAVRRVDLGHLRLWQDDLAEVVRLVQQIPESDIHLEADGNEFDDVSDLPGLSARIRHITVTAAHQQQEILRVDLSQVSCVITATEPSLAMEGAIEAIRRFLASRRRLPIWLVSFFRDLRGWAAPTNQSSSSMSPEHARTGSGLALLVLIGALVVGVLSGISISDRHGRGKYQPLFGWPSSLVIIVSMGIVVAALIWGAIISRTIIFSASRAAAPTWWMRNRAGIVINVVVAGLFFVLGLLVQLAGSPYLTGVLQVAASRPARP